MPITKLVIIGALLYLNGKHFFWFVVAKFIVVFVLDRVSSRPCPAAVRAAPAAAGWWRLALATPCEVSRTSTGLG